MKTIQRKDYAKDIIKKCENAGFSKKGTIAYLADQYNSALALITLLLEKETGKIVEITPNEINK